MLFIVVLIVNVLLRAGSLSPILAGTFYCGFFKLEPSS